MLAFRADVVAFKHASGFYGADSAAASRLRDVGYSTTDLAAPAGDHRLVPTRGGLAARVALFVGVGKLIGLRYDDIRTFGRRALEIAAGMPDVRDLALTAHGRGIGLDEREALLSQIAGFLDALHQPLETSLERVTIVERHPERAELFGQTLNDHLPDIPHASLHSRAKGHWQFRLSTPAERASGPREPQRISLLDRNPDAQPHIFIAYPFTLRDHARFGLERPAHDAGFLARLIGEQAYTGEVLRRIMDQIESAELVVALLTDANPNVYLEVGFAWGRNRPTLLCIQAGDELKFDVAGHRAIEYTDISDLEERFAAYLEEVAQTSDV